MKYLLTHVYIPRESDNTYPTEYGANLCNTFEEAFTLAKKQLAAERETYEVDDCLQCVSYVEDDSLYLECCGGLD